MLSVRQVTDRLRDTSSAVNLLMEFKKIGFESELNIEFYVQLFSEIEAAFETSRCGKPVLIVGEHRFNKYCRSKGTRARWLCSKKTYGCKASVLTINDAIVSINNAHNHRLHNRNDLDKIIYDFGVDKIT